MGTRLAYRDPTGDAVARNEQRPRQAFIDGSGYGLYFRGVRVELTKADFMSVIDSLDLELVKEPGRSPRVWAKKNGKRGNAPRSVTH